MKIRIKKVLYPFIFLIVILFIWDISVKITQTPSYLLPTPINLINYFTDYLIHGDLLSNAWITIKEIFIGTFWGIIVGILLGYLLAKIKVFERLMMPLILIVQIAPKISLAPLFILWFGLGIGSKIALVILVVSFPIMVNEHSALKQIDVSYIEFLEILNASKLQRFISLELPITLSAIISGIKVAVTQAMTGAVIGEMMGAKAGLGYLLVYGSEMYDINIILSAIIALSFIGLFLYYLAAFIEVKLLYWR